MNFNVYIPKDISAKLRQATKAFHCSRNFIVTEALAAWLQVSLPSQWPDNFFNFSPAQDVPDFNALRSDLTDVKNEDPLA